MTATEQTPEARAQERELRATIRNQVIAMGMPSDKAAEITDLACHAAKKAMDAMVAATSVASEPNIKLNSMLIACSLIEVKMQGARELAKALGDAVGLKLMSAKVEVGGQPS